MKNERRTFILQNRNYQTMAPAWVLYLLSFTVMVYVNETTGAAPLMNAKQCIFSANDRHPPVTLSRFSDLDALRQVSRPTYL